MLPVPIRRGQSEPELKIVKVCHYGVIRQINILLLGLSRTAIFSETTVFIEKRQFEDLAHLFNIELSMGFGGTSLEVFEPGQRIADRITDLESPIWIQEGVDDREIIAIG